MKRARLNIVLLLLAAGLGVGVWFSQEAEEKGPPLTPYTAETLNKIVIEHPGREAIRLEKTGNDWRLLEPGQAAVDPFEISGLLDLATREAKQSLEVGSVKLAEMGLDPPRYTVSFNGTKVEVGSTEPLNYRRYVKVGSAVSLIEDPPSAALDADHHDLVSKKLLAGGQAVERIEVPGLLLAKGEGGGWELTPADPEATTDRMQKLADGWKSANAMWNEMPPEGQPQQGEPIRITLADGEPRDFVLIEREPQFRLYNPRARVIHVLSKALTEELLQLPVIPEPEADAGEEESGNEDGGSGDGGSEAGAEDAKP